MAQGNLPNCLAVTLPHEGGWADHPRDPGGATMKGITIATYRRYRPGATKAQLRAITDAEVRSIYDDGYWSPIKGDALPFGVDLSTFDYGVNAGPSRSVKDLQRVVGVAADGVVGPVTLAAVRKANGKAVVQGHCARRLSFKRGLSHWETFKRGWSRRVADVEAKGVAMWLAATSMHPRKDELEQEADRAAGKAATQDKAAGGTAAGGSAVGGGEAAVTGDPNWLLIGGIALVVLVVAGFLILKARQNKDRAEAYARVAKSA